eukprot:3651992-Prymnesium_polylepis.1
MAPLGTAQSPATSCSIWVSANAEKSFFRQVPYSVHGRDGPRRITQPAPPGARTPTHPAGRSAKPPLSASHWTHRFPTP